MMALTWQYFQVKKKGKIVIFHFLNIGGLLLNFNNDTLLFFARMSADTLKFKSMGFFGVEAPNFVPMGKFSGKHLVCSTFSIRRSIQS